MIVIGRKQKNNNIEKGQALLVIVLIMVVALTVGLSIATRSITNSRVSKEEDDSQRAFSAAEAGVEQLLKSQENEIPENFIAQTSTKYSARVITQPSTELLFNNGNLVQKDIGVDLWMSDYPDYLNPLTGTYRIYWGEEDGCRGNPQTAAAIEVVVLFGPSKSDPHTTHFVFDPCPARRAQNNFGVPNTVDVTLLGRDFKYNANFSVTDGYIARIIPLYSSTRIGVTGNIRPQGREVESTGSSGGTVRRVRVFQSYPSLPIEIFPNVIFSPQ
jgi:hypothetical protein